MNEVPSLPYKYSDLEPYIDEETMRIHHTKHHEAYAEKLNAALDKHPELKEKDVMGLIRNAEKQLPEDIRSAVINNGGGYLNHLFFWTILAKPADQDNKPAGTTVGVMIDEELGGYDQFKNLFKEKALGLFGSGWTWLAVNEEGKLEIVNTANQNLLPASYRPLITIDVWEHAYYLKYQNRRADYIEAFFHVINWKQADAYLKEAKPGDQAAA